MARYPQAVENGSSADPPVVGIVPLEAILRTEELWRRPARPPDYETENRVLTGLVQALADAPSTILQTLADTLLDVFQAHSAGLSLLTEDGDGFYWAAIAGQWKPHIGGGTPRDFGPCSDVLDHGAPLLFTRWERRYPYLLEAIPIAEEGLLVPFYVGGEAVGTIWTIAHDESRRFDAEDMRQLQCFGRFASAAYQAVGFQHDISAHEHTEKRQQMLIEELNHRVKNTLATVQSIAAHTLIASSDIERRKDFEARLLALSRTHNLLSDRSWESVSLRSLLLQELDPYQSTDGANRAIEGPDVALQPKEALALGLAFHELATNAAKYGGLSAPGSQVRVTWDILNSLDGHMLRLTWAETGVIPVKGARRKGFGFTLLERGLSFELDGTVVLDLGSDGLVCTMKIPLPERHPAG